MNGDAVEGTHFNERIRMHGLDVLSWVFVRALILAICALSTEWISGSEAGHKYACYYVTMGLLNHVHCPGEMLCWDKFVWVHPDPVRLCQGCSALQRYVARIKGHGPSCQLIRWASPQDGRTASSIAMISRSPENWLVSNGLLAIETESEPDKIVSGQMHIYFMIYLFLVLVRVRA